MKKTITSLLSASFLMITGLLNAQTFTETMGTNATSSGVAISTYESNGYFVNTPFTMTGTGDVRTTSACALTGSSGGANVYLAPTKTFEIAGINTTSLTNLALAFNVNKNTIAATSLNLKVEYSTDGTTYTALIWNSDLPTGSGTGIWHSRSVSGIPSAANVRLRFTNTFATGNQYRLDDLVLAGTVLCTPPTVTISSSVPNATLCASGGDAATALTANLSGGVGSWNYQWKYWNGSSFTSINGGTNAIQNASPTNTLDYQVIVTSTTNAQCTASAIQTVTVVADPILSVSSSNVVCYGDNNGTAAGSLTGGTAGNTYTLNWSPGTPAGDGTLNISGLAPGTYTLTANGLYGCNASGSVTITQPTVLTSASTSGLIACNGGTTTVSVSANGGTAPYSGTGNFTVGAGTYSYTVTDANGCTSITSITVSEPALLTVNAGGDETVFVGYGPLSCASLDAEINGGTQAYSATWSSIQSGGGIGTAILACPTSNEVYTISVVDANGCTASDELSICVIDVSCEAGNSGNMKVEMCQVPPGNPGNAHTICIDASAVPAHLAIGCVLGACGELENACAFSAERSFTNSIGVDNTLEAAIGVYPNPVDNTTTISVTPKTSGEYSVTMFDMMGKVVMNIYTGSFGEYENLTFDVNMTSLMNGIYIVTINKGDELIENVRVVKQ